VAHQLGREPRGVLEIAYRCPNGEPGVVKTAPKLPDGTPFPTLYYLTHPVLTAAASGLESTGLMREMTERLRQDPELAAAYRHLSFLYACAAYGESLPAECNLEPLKEIWRQFTWHQANAPATS